MWTLQETRAMRERPILFSGEMVRAILDGQKTQTRRVMKLQPTCRPNLFNGATARTYAGPLWKGQTLAVWPGESEFDYCDCHCPYGKPGDRLWVRETHHVPGGYLDDYELTEIREGISTPETFGVTYKADCPHMRPHDGGWTPSIHMPRALSRITLDITDVRVERLLEISEQDAYSEGVDGPTYVAATGNPQATYQNTFALLWDSINGKKHPWYSNPWVWVVEFRPIPTGDKEHG